MAGNQSNYVAWKGAYFANVPGISLISPSSDTDTVVIVPADVIDSIGPEIPKCFGLRFEVTGLPDDDYDLLKEVKVTNEATLLEEVEKEGGFVSALFSHCLAYGLEVDYQWGDTVSNRFDIVVIDDVGHTLTKSVFVAVIAQQ